MTSELNRIAPERPTRATRGSTLRGARRIGVIAVAAALAAPLALPAFASGESGAQQSMSAIGSESAQTVSGVVTAGGSGLSEDRLEVRATTAEELAQIRTEIEAAMQREEQARQEAEQARQEAAPTTGGNAATSGATTPSEASPASGASTAASAGASGSAIANAALAQVGVSQDCVALVRKAIAAAGLPYSGMGSLFNLGPTIPMSAASPGDVIYYADGGVGRAHIGIYIGGGRAVHGGWSGFNTVIAGVDIGGSAPVFIDIT